MAWILSSAHPCHKVFAFLGAVHTGNSLFIQLSNLFIIIIVIIITNCFCPVSPVCRLRDTRINTRITITSSASLIGCCHLPRHTIPPILSKTVRFGTSMVCLNYARFPVFSRSIIASRKSLARVVPYQFQTATCTNNHVSPRSVRKEGDHGRC